MNDLHKVFYSRSIDLIFELKIQCDAYNEWKKQLKMKKKKSAQEKNSVQKTATSSQMFKLHSDKLQEQQTIQLETIEHSETHQQQLMQQWKCISENCDNQNNFCYVDSVDQLYYILNSVQHEFWANVIVSEETIIEASFIKLYIYLRKQQSAVNRSFQRSLKITAAQQNKILMKIMMKMQKTQFELQTQTMMMNFMISMQKSQEAHEQQQE